jgi:hypothetical protein
MRSALLFVGTLALFACGDRPAKSPLAAPDPPPTAEQRAAFEDALARCQSEDDCADLSRHYADGVGTKLDRELQLAAALKGCLAGNQDLCQRATFMRDHIAAPGTLAMANAMCTSPEVNRFVCDERKELVADEARASDRIQQTCAQLRSPSAPADPAALGPLVDVCPGRASNAQRERARLFRSEAEIRKAYLALTSSPMSASPRQLRKFYERLSPLGDPRADEVLALGLRRFGAPRTPEFAKRRDATLGIPFMQPRMDLCAIESEHAFWTEQRSQDVPLIPLLRIFVPLVFPVSLPFFLYAADDKPTAQEQRELDEAARKHAAEVEQKLRVSTGATRFTWLGSCDDVEWFVAQAQKSGSAKHQ